MKKPLQITLFLLLLMFVLVPSAQTKAKKKLRFTKSKVTIDIYKGTTTTVKVKKSGLSGRAYFTTNNPKVATVSSRGYVVARGKMGKATITAYCGKYKAKCVIRVKSSKVDFELPSYQFSVTKGYKAGINYLAKGTFAKPTWTSSNKNIATVNSIGSVTGVSCGTTTIIGKVSGKTRRLTVHVLENGVVAKAYNDFLSQELVPTGINDIPTEQKYVGFTFRNIDQDGIGELFVFAKEGGAGYTQYDNVTVYTYRNGGLLKLGNVTCGITSPCKWYLHFSHNNVVISTLTKVISEGVFKEYYYQLKNDKLSLVTQTSMEKENWAGPYKNYAYANALGQPITKEAHDAVLKQLNLGSVLSNFIADDTEYARKKVFG